MEDGSTVTVDVPDALLIEVGSVVTEIDTADGQADLQLGVAGRRYRQSLLGGGDHSPVTESARSTPFGVNRHVSSCASA